MASIYDDEIQPSGKYYGQKARAALEDAPTNTVGYLKSLFPILHWLPNYNFIWLYGDLVAGITVGLVVVPQSMGYAIIAGLPPQIGLYSSFVGVTLYCLFATSKDVTIGPTAVMSLLIGQTVASLANATYSAITIATAIALLAGIIAFVIGITRLGFLVNFIPTTVIAGFTTGSAITIALGQFPNLFGITIKDPRGAGYLILAEWLVGLPKTNLNAAFGLVGLFLLYLVRYLAKIFTRRFPRYERPIFFFNIARNVLLVIFSAVIAYGISIGQKTPLVKVLGTVPPGFQLVGVPKLDGTLLNLIASTIPIATFILVLEHVAIAKSFGRINDYTINPNQELIAIGVTNIIASFFSAYPATGSFSRTAIKAKSGVRTPIAGIFSGVIVILSLYALTPAFYWIPNATLAAVIIHAVGDLISGWKTIKQFWNVNPIELFIFVTSVIITFFTTVEIGIYVSLGLSIAVLLFRIALPRTNSLTRLRLYGHDASETKYVYVPTSHSATQDADVVDAIPDGVLVFRFEEALTFPNAGYVTDKIVQYVKAHTKRGKPVELNRGDRPWNDVGDDGDDKEALPVVRAIVLDLSGLNTIDSTGLQALLDVRNAINKYADASVQWHFANIHELSVRRTLVSGGFGVKSDGQLEAAPVVPSADDSQAPEKSADIEIASPSSQRNGKQAVTTRFPFFHADLDDAVNAAIASL